MKKETPIVTVHYLNTSPLEIEGPLKSIIKKMLQIETDKGNKPFYIEVNQVKYLYNRDIYTDFLNGTYKNLQVFEDLKFDKLCRNKVIMIIEGNEVDQGSLWVQWDNKVQLVDEDSFLETDYNVNLFTDQL